MDGINSFSIDFPGRFLNGYSKNERGAEAEEQQTVKRVWMLERSERGEEEGKGWEEGRRAGADHLLFLRERERHGYLAAKTWKKF